MDYHSTKENILMPEYGRTIQGYLQYAKTIPDARKRQKTVEAIIVLMQQINPAGQKNVEDYREKLWNHAFKITNYELEVTPPAGIVIRRDADKQIKGAVEYPEPTTKFRHYGRNVQTLMHKAIEMPDGGKKEGFVEVIASYMKLAYKTWNKEHYVSDDVVKDDLEFLSEGQLALHEGHSSLDTLAYSANRREQEIKKSQRGGRKRGGSGSGGGKNMGSGGRQRKSNGGGNLGGNGGGRRRKK